MEVINPFEQYKQHSPVPIRSWAVNIEKGALEQAENLANLPFAISHIALMPDAHQGYGMPIGGVLFADKAIVPNAVGVDIGCGVSLIQTELNLLDLYDGFLQDHLDDFLEQIFKTVPVGNGPRGEHRNASGEEFIWPDTDISVIAGNAIDGADSQLGTLGGGNHFLELQRDDEQNIWFMLHSGSRSVGKRICDYWDGVAAELNTKWHSKIPNYAQKGDRLAFLPWESDEGQGYYNDMKMAMEWAEENRRRMAGKVISAFGEQFGTNAWQVLDVHHNYAQWENHMGRNGIVHRKGAVRAQEGEQVLIPGSMGTASYVAEGLGNILSFNTCQHGAGRARSRGETRRSTSVEEMDAQLAGAGVTLVTNDRNSVIDESSIAYKDIESVMEASSDLIVPIRKLYPIGVVKG